MFSPKKCGDPCPIAQDYWVKRRGDQRTDSIGSLGQRTANGAIGADEDSTWCSRGLIRLVAAAHGSARTR